MKKNDKPRITNRLLLWVLQFGATAVISALAALSIVAGSIVHAVVLYVILPVCSACIAGMFVYKGLNNYVALIAAATAFPLCHLLIWGYLPSFAPVIVCVIITVFGSATGEILKQRSLQSNK